MLFILVIWTEKRCVESSLKFLRGDWPITIVLLYLKSCSHPKLLNHLHGWVQTLATLNDVTKSRIQNALTILILIRVGNCRRSHLELESTLTASKAGNRSSVAPFC